MRCKIPYGSGAIDLELPDEVVAGVLESGVEPAKSSASEDDIVLAAMARGIVGEDAKITVIPNGIAVIVQGD